MRAIDLETRVITAVDQIRAGQQVEHDFIECKRDWPTDNKARQLAGSLNRAGGDPVIYIIGIDEKSKEVFDVSDTDVLNWWRQIAPKFDQAPPEMIRHIPVVVGEGEHVVAVAFASDRAPYVVKTGLANPEFEVPMREATGTRSARRDELLRMLIPTASVPQAVALEAALSLEQIPATAEMSHPDEGYIVPAKAMRLHSYGSLRIYIEHNGKDLISFPAHGTRGCVVVEGQKRPMRVQQRRERGAVSLRGSSDMLTSVVSHDGVTLNQPGALTVDLEVLDLDAKDDVLFANADTIRFEVELDVLHAMRPLKVDVTLNRTQEDWDSYDSTTFGRHVGEWDFNHPGRWTNG